MGPRTTNIEVGVLARAIGQTRRYLWPKMKPLREPKDVGRAITEEEEQRLMSAAAANKSPYIRLGLVIALTTGMRVREIEGLQWGQVDFDRTEIRVGESKTVTGEGRVIPMNAGLRASIEAHASWFVSRFGVINPAHYVFPGCRAKKPVDSTKPTTAMSTAWFSVQNTAGVSVRFHDLRHTAASRMGRGGASRAAMMRILGHASQSLVDRYCHAKERDVRAAVDTQSLAKVEVERHSERHGGPKVAVKPTGKRLSIQ